MGSSTTRSQRRHRSAFLSRVALAACSCIGLAEAGNRIVFDSQRALVTTRLDPIIFPGSISQHVHRVIGGNNFNATYDPAVYRNSTCSSMAPQADMSNYWHPSVYKVILQPDGSQKYSPMWGQTRIYYNFPTLKKGTGAGTFVEPFPENFQMVAGSPGKKTGGGYSQEDLSIFYYCERDYANGTVVGTSTYDLPKSGCSFLTTKVWFPSCWNGQAFDLSNPNGHVKYPTIGAGLTGPNCPVGYERRIPSILVETFYFGYGTNGWMQWYQGPGDEFGGNANLAPTYILANGDTTGYGLHADFANGWNQTVLSQVVTQCLDTNGDLRADKACPPLAPSWNQNTANNCHLSTNTKIPDEPIGIENPLDALPGCNLPWASGTKPTCAGYQERRWTNWGRLVGPELNEEPTLADLANDPFGLNATTSTSIGSATTTGQSASTSLSLDTNATTLTIPTTSVYIPTTTILSEATATFFANSTTISTDISTGGSTGLDVSLTRGQDGTTIDPSASSSTASVVTSSSDLPSSSMATSVASLPLSDTSVLTSTSSGLTLSTSQISTSSGLTSIASQISTSSGLTSIASQASTSTKATSTSKASTTSKATTTSKVTTTSKASTTSKATTTSKPTTTSKATTTSKVTSTSKSTTTSKPATTSKVATTSKAASTTSKATSTSKPSTTSKATTTSKPATSSKVTTTSKAASTSSKTTSSLSTSTSAATSSALTLSTSTASASSSSSSITDGQNTSTSISGSLISTGSASDPSSTAPSSQASTSGSDSLSSGGTSSTPAASSQSNTVTSSSSVSSSISDSSAPSQTTTSSIATPAVPTTSSSIISSPAQSSSKPALIVTTSSSKVSLMPGRGAAVKPSTPSTTQKTSSSASRSSSVVTSTSPALSSNILASPSTSSIPVYTSTAPLALGRGQALLRPSGSSSSDKLLETSQAETPTTTSVKLAPMRGFNNPAS